MGLEKKNPLKRELQVARNAAREAARFIIQYGKMTEQEKKETLELTEKKDRTIVTSIDKVADSIIYGQIKKTFVDDRVIGEENNKERRRVYQSTRYWVYDPIDGTSSFVRNGEDYGVLIGLIENGIPKLSVAYNIPKNECNWAVEGDGAFKRRGQGKNEVLSTSKDEKITMMVSPSRRGKEKLERLIVALNLDRNKDITLMRTCFKAVAIAQGQATAYFVPPGRDNALSIWDIAGFHRIVLEAGGNVKTAYGDPVDYRKMLRDKDLRNYDGLLVTANPIVEKKISEVIFNNRKSFI